MLTLREGDFGAFFAAPFEAYGHGTPYVSPMHGDLRRLLDPQRNPLCADGHGAFTFFTAHDGRRPVGRIVAQVHHASNRRHGLARSGFGFFDCVDDREAAGLLLDAAETWGRRQGCREIAGNFNLTAMQQLGVVTEGFRGVPYTDMMYNPPHIPRLLDAHGYETFFPMGTFELDLTTFTPERMLGARQQALLADPAFRWDRLRRRGFRRCMAETRALLNASFAENPMFVPPTMREFLFQAGEMMWIVDERISALVYRDGRPAGVVVCIPDLNGFVRATRSRLRPATLLHFVRYRLCRRRALIVFWAVSPDLQNLGLTGAMLYRVTRALRASGYTRLGLTWIADVNGPSLRQIEKLGARPLHRLYLFRKVL